MIHWATSWHRIATISNHFLLFSCSMACCFFKALCPPITPRQERLLIGGTSLGNHLGGACYIQNNNPNYQILQSRCLDQGLLDARRALLIPHVHAWVVGLRQSFPQMLYAQRGINYIKNQKTLKQMKTDVWRNKKKRIHLSKTCRPGQVWTGSHSTKLEQCN